MHIPYFYHAYVGDLRYHIDYAGLGNAASEGAWTVDILAGIKYSLYTCHAEACSTHEYIHDSNLKQVIHQHYLQPRSFLKVVT